MRRAPFSGVRVAAAFGPRVLIVHLADRDHAHLGELDDGRGLARRIEHRETLARLRDGLGGMLEDLKRPVSAVFLPASMAATPLSRSGPGKASSITGRSTESMARTYSSPPRPRDAAAAARPRSSADLADRRVSRHQPHACGSTTGFAGLLGEVPGRSCAPVGARWWQAEGLPVSASRRSAIAAALPSLGGNVRVVAARELWQARAAWATMPGWLVMTAGPRRGGRR